MRAQAPNICRSIGTRSFAPCYYPDGGPTPGDHRSRLPSRARKLTRLNPSVHGGSSLTRSVRPGALVTTSQETRQSGRIRDIQGARHGVIGNADVHRGCAFIRAPEGRPADSRISLTEDCLPSRQSPTGEFHKVYAWIQRRWMPLTPRHRGLHAQPRAARLLHIQQTQRRPA